MAVDTKDKRASVAQELGGLFIEILPDPDGTIDQGDRQQTAVCYRGILAAIIPVVATVRDIIYITRTSREIHYITRTSRSEG